MKQYIDLLKDVLENGVWKMPAREGMPRTKEVFCRTMRFDLSEGFPLLTTKKMFTKGIVGELLWFLRGDTNIKYLVENGIHIWDADAYKFYKQLGGYLGKEAWLACVTGTPELSSIIGGDYDKNLLVRGYHYGDCGSIYGHQWRLWNGFFDQIGSLVSNLKGNPNSRYHIVTAWQPTDFLETQKYAALPACHTMFQCSVRGGKLDLMMLQRSCDSFLGVPFNIASYALLTHILAAVVGLEPGEFVWIGNSVHIYENHIEQATEQISREPYSLCQLKFEPKSNLEDYEISDFEFVGYESHPSIKAPLSVGV